MHNFKPHASSRQSEQSPAPRGSGGLLKPILLAALLCELVVSVFWLSSSQLLIDTSVLTARSGMEDFSNGVINLSSEALSGIYSMPKVYTLPFNSEPGPVPNSELYVSTKDTELLSQKVTTFSPEAWDGSDIFMYEDETIKAYAWRERIDIETEETYNFADITIAHPSQLRRYYAGGEFDMNTRYYPQVMAEKTNAVVAVTGDFYNYRTYGVVVNNGVIYRDEQRLSMPYVLFVDKQGNLNVEYCTGDFDVQNYINEHDITFNVCFGPALVLDGHILTAKEAYAYDQTEGSDGWIYGWAPRAAIGQLGELHYLLCTVDGKNEGYHGTRSYILAQVMDAKHCYVAYNLDGGHTATLVTGGQVFNRVAFGGQRASSDLIYFATAIPNEQEGGNA